MDVFKGEVMVCAGEAGGEFAGANVAACVLIPSTQSPVMAVSARHREIGRKEWADVLINVSFRDV
jgi:hypothetical protein